MVIGILIHGAVYSDEIYKSVDEYGNVTYSTQPPENDDEVQVMQAVPEPSAEEIADAVRRYTELLQSQNASESEHGENNPDNQANIPDTNDQQPSAAEAAVKSSNNNLPPPNAIPFF